jgi:hypothetical protein
VCESRFVFNTKELLQIKDDTPISTMRERLVWSIGRMLQTWANAKKGFTLARLWEVMHCSLAHAATLGVTPPLPPSEMTKSMS